MQPMPATIPVRSERQAMDWSLVLISQGIGSTIERVAESDLWQLVLDAPDHERALQAIRQYHAENRRNIWRQPLPWTGLVFDWRSLLPLIIFVFLFAVEATGRGNLRAPGMMDNTAVQAGQWWRLVTAVMLHADMAHLAANVTTGLVLLGLALGVYGPGLGLLVTALAGVGGNVAGLLFYPASHHGVGASGMIMGALGLLAAQWLTLLRRGLTPRQLAARGVFSGGLLLVLLGFSPERNVDVLAHVAGFLTGLVFGAALAFLPERVRSSEWFDHVAALGCGMLIGISWFLALS